MKKEKIEKLSKDLVKSFALFDESLTDIKVDVYDKDALESKNNACEKLGGFRFYLNELLKELENIEVKDERN